MQEKAFAARTAQYLLIKAPPASGKSRALMFIALDKLQNQGIKKVIVAVPEKSIGASFGATELKQYGFFADWNPSPKYNLCTPGSERSKVAAFLEFLENDDTILICTHATLVAIDEFHHVSADGVMLYLESANLGSVQVGKDLRKDVIKVDFEISEEWAIRNTVLITLPAPLQGVHLLLLPLPRANSLCVSIQNSFRGKAAVPGRLRQALRQCRV